MSYREWVGPPPSWWVLSVLFSLSWLVAIGFYLGPLAGGLGLLGAQAVVTAVLTYGRSTRWARASAPGPVRVWVASASMPRTAET